MANNLQGKPGTQFPDSWSVWQTHFPAIELQTGERGDLPVVDGDWSTDVVKEFFYVVGGNTFGRCTLLIKHPPFSSTAHVMDIKQSAQEEISPRARLVGLSTHPGLPECLMLDAEQCRMHSWHHKHWHRIDAWPLSVTLDRDSRVLVVEPGRVECIYVSLPSKGQVVRMRRGDNEQLTEPEVVAGGGEEAPPRGAGACLRARDVELSRPSALAYDDATDMLFIADPRDHIVYGVSVNNGTIQVALGTGVRGRSPANMPGPGTALSTPTSVAVLSYFETAEDGVRTRRYLLTADHGNARLLRTDLNTDRRSTDTIMGGKRGRKIYSPTFLKKDVTEHSCGAPLLVRVSRNNQVMVIGQHQQTLVTVLAPPVKQRSVQPGQALKNRLS